MRNIWIKAVVGLIFLSLMMSACQKLENLDGLETTGYEAEYAVPLFKGQANLGDLFNNLDAGASLSIGRNGLFTFNYDSPVSGQTSQEIFELFSSFPPFPVDTMMAIPFQPPNNIDIDQIDLMTGTISYTYQSPFAEDVSVELMIPQATRAGEVFKKEIGVSYTGQDLPIQVPVSEIDLAGYTIVPQNDSIFIQYRATTASGQRVELDGFIMLIGNMEFAYAEGYMGSEVFDFGTERLTIDFFDDWTQGNVRFENPRIDLVVDNSFGFPIQVNPQFINIKVRDGSVIPLISPFITSGVRIDYPQLWERGQTKTTKVSFSGTNSNIKQILAAGPVEVEYDIDAIPNPDADPNFTGFMTDQSQFDIQLQLSLPLWGSASDFVTLDTFEVNFEEYENVDFAEFRLATENGLPLEVALQLYFADDNGVVLDSLFTNQEILLAAAEVDAGGTVTLPAEKITEIPRTSDEFGMLKTATQLYLRAAFQTSSEGSVPVRITSDQNVEMKMGMKIGYKK